MISNTFASVLLLFASVSCIFVFSSVHGNPANHGKFYVFSNRKGCLSVESKPPCPASRINPMFATNYDRRIKEAQSLMDDVEKINVNNSECIASFKTAYCSEFTAKCFEDGGRDFGNASAACWKANSTCENVIFVNFEEYCQSIPKGKQLLSECVLPSTHINGSCPEPEYKMSADYLNIYEKKSKAFKEWKFSEQEETFRYPNNTKLNGSLRGRLVFSRHCILKVKEIRCMPLYCSADEERLLNKYNWKTCKQTVDTCFDKAIEILQDEDKERLQERKQFYVDFCDYYPNSTKTEFAPGVAANNCKPWHQYFFILVFAVFIHLIV